MPNLNYLGDNVARDVAQTLAEIIVEEIQKNNKVTREQIACIANVSKKTVERELKKMNNVRYVCKGVTYEHREDRKNQSVHIGAEIAGAEGFDACRLYEGLHFQDYMNKKPRVLKRYDKNDR